MNQVESLAELLRIMDDLLSPQGCPWDREQTHESLTRYLIEESYEVVEAIQAQNMPQLQEELGDVLLQIVFHAALAKAAGYFDFYDIAQTVGEKMVRRHPHVFASLQLGTSNEVMGIWENFKKKEGKTRILEGIPSMLPGLMRAEKIQAKAARVGFDWADISGAMEKLLEEAGELAQAEDESSMEEELGDLLFALVNIARFKNIDPELALQRTNDKFIRRFNYIEEQLAEQKLSWGQVDLSDLDQLWEDAKIKGL